MTKRRIAVAGATGDLGGRIIGALVERGAEVCALVRPATATEKRSALARPGVDVVAVDLADRAALTKALAGSDCVVSTLQGLHDVIVDVQSTLLDAAVDAGVPRFIPSDFSSDFFKIAPGDNRNFDLRREFHQRLHQAKVMGTTILNGAFAEILGYNIPFLDFKAKRVGYWESPDWKVDFTTMDNTAAFTAAAALDPTAPSVLKIAGFQVSATELATVASELSKTQFEAVEMGTRADLAAHNKRERALHPEGETDVFCSWQRSQYMHSMFTAQLAPLDNDRYPGIEWTGVEQVVKTILSRAK